ncbi:hypothetical protein BDZ97DRAFT_1761270 [Flammula alnicola]|nr:hypothetical protein BDZ97DRAFT_1761270 [Flammula alnicola]
MATTDNRPPARLIIRRLERYPNAAIWGIPVDLSLMVAEFKRTAPPNIGGEERMRLLDIYVDRVFSVLEAKCRSVWRSGIIGPREVYASGKRSGEKTIIAVVRSTRPDDKFLPPPDKVEELKKFFAAQGFTEDPDWFIALD